MEKLALLGICSLVAVCTIILIKLIYMICPIATILFIALTGLFYHIVTSKKSNKS